MRKKLLISFAFFISFVPLSFALEIPIEGVLLRDNKVSKGIIFVDMERIFALHPMSERYKKEIQNFADSRKTAIEALIRQYEESKKQIVDINNKIVEASAGPAENQDQILADLSKQLESAQKSLEEQRLKITDLSSRTKSEIMAMEEKNSLIVLKDIDAIIKDIARKRNADIVLDKQSVLCGSENCEDVTDEVIKKLTKEGRNSSLLSSPNASVGDPNLDQKGR